MSTPPPERRHVTFVCTGNICRSPMAEGLLRHALRAHPEPLRSLPVRSAGTAAANGEPATPNALSALRSVGIDIGAHRSCPMTSALAATSLVIYVMTREHIYALRHLPAVPPLRLMLAPHLPPAAAITSTREIDDPYGQNLSAYESCRDTMVAAIPALVTHIRDLLANATH